MDTTSVNRTIKGEHYIALLLRLWQESDEEPWRAMIEDPVSGIRQGFPDLPALFEYLQAQTVTTSETGDELTE